MDVDRIAVVVAAAACVVALVAYVRWRRGRAERAALRQAESNAAWLAELIAAREEETERSARAPLPGTAETERLLRLLSALEDDEPTSSMGVAWRDPT